MVQQSRAMLSLALLVTAGLAGCVDPSSTPLATGPEPPANAAPRSIFDEWAAFEPTVAVAPDGTVYATSSWGSPMIAVRPDGTTERLEAPVAPLAPFLGAQPADVMLQTDAEGRLYYHALLYHYENNPAFGAFMLLGIHVAVSDDGGKTWSVNEQVSLPGSEGLPQLGADRQWLATGADGTLYLVYQRVPAVLSPHVGGFVVTQHYMLNEAAVMVARSDDGGRSWSTFQTASGPAYAVINGQPHVDDDGRLLVPYFEYGSELALRIAVSEDGGKTFTRSKVYAHDEFPGAWFPSLASLGNDRWAIAWVGTDNVLSVATSDDDGATWTAPVVWSAPTETVATSPWAVVANETLHVLWFRDEAETTSSLWWSQAPLAALEVPDRRLVDPLINGTTTKRAMTDFAHAVVAGGRLHTVWSDLEDPQLWYLAQPLA